MKLSKIEVRTLRSILKKIEEQNNQEKIRIQSRRRAQKKGKTIVRTLQKKNKPTRGSRRVTKKRSSIR